MDDRNFRTKQGTPATLLLLLLGATSAGAWLVQSSRPLDDNARSRATVVASPVAPPTVVGGDDNLVSQTPLLRPLALLASALGPEPLFWLQHAGKPAASDYFVQYLTSEKEDAPRPGVVNRGGSQFDSLEVRLQPTQRDCPKRLAPIVSPQQRGNECSLIAAILRRTESRRVSVTTVVATLPDWVDSSLQWAFDPMVDAIQTLAGQMNYSLAGFDPVDTEPAAQEIQPKGSVWPYPKVHELTPGALLFRSNSGSDLLLVLLVGETATAGAHPAALANALDLAFELRTADTKRRDSNKPILVLAPTFSGSASPLLAALLSATDRHHSEYDRYPIFRLVTGSATDPKNAELFGRDPRLVKFEATTRSDPEELLALANYFGRVNRRLQCGQHVGLLIEANTSWGHDVSALDQSKEDQPLQPKYDRKLPRTEAQKLQTACDECGRDPETYYSDRASHAFPCAAVAHFPLHISRLRAESQQLLTTASQHLPGRAAVALDLGESLPPTDRVPPETPQLTAAAEEAALSGMFDVLGDDQISAIGVFATDKRDHIYLAEEIARHHPNVLAFTLESSLLYLHPDVTSFVRGTIIASTYSLNPRTQQLALPGLRSPEQFTASNAHGIYNALALLLDRPDLLVDYASPFFPGVSQRPASQDCATQPCAPPVWISVVGRNGLFPVFADTDPKCSGGYVTCVRANPTQSNLRRRPFLQTRHLILLEVIGLIVLMLLTLGAAHKSTAEASAAAAEDSAAALRQGRKSILTWIRDALIVVDDPSQNRTYRTERACALGASRIAIALVILWAAKLILIYACDALTLPPSAGQHVFYVISMVGFAYVISQVYIGFWRYPHHPRDGVVYSGALLFLICAAALVVSGSPSDDAPEFAKLAHPANRVVLTILLIVGLGGAAAAVYGDSPRPEVSETLRWRRLTTLVGLVAFVGLWVNLTFSDWHASESLLYANRTASIPSFISPATCIIFVSISLFWWGIWSLRRVRLLLLPEIEIGIGSLLSRCSRTAGMDPTVAFRSPVVSIGARSSALCVLLTLILVYGSYNIGSIDGHAFSVFLLFGPLCLLAIATHTLAQSSILGRSVLLLLHTLERQPGADNFAIIGKSPFPWHVTFKEPHFGQIEPLLRRLAVVAQLLSGLNGDHKSAKLREVVRVAVLRLRQAHRHEFGTKPLRRSDWESLDRVTRHLDVYLRRTRGTSESDIATNSGEVRREMECVIFFYAALILRDLVTRLISGYTIVLGTLLLLLASHLTYTFQGRVFWLSLDAAAIALAALLAIQQLIALERDTIMSLLWRTTPGRISLFRGLTWQMMGYALVTIATLFLVFFPELGGSFGDWISSVRGVLH